MSQTMPVPVHTVSASQVGTHAPLGEYSQPVAARKNISGFFIHNGNIYWNLKKN